MTDFVTSLIRTYVPIAVGALISFLATKDIALDPSAAAGLITFLTALLQGAYYLVIRLLEQRFPQVGILLGSRKTPEYFED